MAGVDAIPAGLVIVIALFLILVAILWFLLPFAVFGMKPRMDKLEVQAKEANETLKEIEKQLLAMNKQAKSNTKNQEVRELAAD